MSVQYPERQRASVNDAIKHNVRDDWERPDVSPELGSEPAGVRMPRNYSQKRFTNPVR